MPNAVLDTASPPQATKEVVSLRATVIGNVLEWLDWSVYATFSPYIAKALFAPTDAASALLQTLAIFADGFLARPIGSVFFGKLSNRRGRQYTLVVTMVLMALGSLILAVTPTYSRVGAFASAWLLCARLVQGFAHGGETSASFVYVGELAPAARRGLWSSSVFASSTLGVVIGSLMGVALTQTISSDALAAWGWRIPFALGAILAVYAYYLRSKSIETASYLERQRSSPPAASSRTDRATLVHGLRLAIVVGATSVAYYTWLSFATSYAITSKGVPADTAFIASLCAQMICIVVMPFLGSLSDRIGRKPLALMATVGFVLASFPLDALFTSSAASLFLAQSIALILWACVGALYPALMVEQFATGPRALAIGVSYTGATVIFGGTAPYLNAWLSSINMHWVFTAYTVVLSGMAAIAVMTMKETTGLDLVTMRKR